MNQSISNFVFPLLWIFLFVASCTSASNNSMEKNKKDLSENIAKKDTTGITKGALLLTRFNSLEELKQTIDIKYFDGMSGAAPMVHAAPYVRIIHRTNGQEVVSILQTGVSEKDILKAWTGTLWSKIWLGLNNPYLIINKRNLPRVFSLSRRRGWIFGEGDVAFYDLAEAMLHNITDSDMAMLSPRDSSEKGYINTFNHFNSQAFMTSIFSERLADFIADTHERASMPELITGDFTEEQILDLENGPLDNYVDIINNEWGQEVGKELREKYNINQQTHWTPTLLADYLNDIQIHYSWAFQIGFKPFKSTDQLVVKFANKINTVMEDTTGLRLKKKNKK
ncbi:MAG: hypothetical protein AB8F74_18660 [Saprospiraceae bacterium]